MTNHSCKIAFKNGLLHNVEASLPKGEAFVAFKKNALSTKKTMLAACMASVAMSCLAVAAIVTFFSVTRNEYHGWIRSRLTFDDYSDFSTCVADNSDYTTNALQNYQNRSFSPFLVRTENAETLIGSTPYFTIEGRHIRNGDEQLAITRMSATYNSNPDKSGSESANAGHKSWNSVNLYFQHLLFDPPSAPSLYWSKEIPPEWLEEGGRYWNYAVDFSLHYVAYHNVLGEDQKLRVDYLIDGSVGQIVCGIDYYNLEFDSAVSKSEKESHATLVAEFKNAVLRDVVDNYKGDYI
ncbi:MAG: hypothetical protein J6A47_06805 [Bacilli bacterium]|nr:hypothetical protein [Bacilli bacterium]